MDRDFFISKQSFCKRNASTSRSIDVVSKTGAYSIEHLMKLASEGKQLPQLKNYSYSPSDSVNLNVPTNVPRDMVSLFALQQKGNKLASDLQAHNAKVASDKAKADLDAQIEARAQEIATQKVNEMSNSKDS